MQVWHFCASAVDISREQGGVSNVVRALAVEGATAGIPTTIVCGNRELGLPKQPVGDTRPRSNLRVRTIAQHANPALGPTAAVRAAVEEIPAGSVAHVHSCFSAFAEVAMSALHRRGIPFVFSAHGKLAKAALSRRELQKRLWWTAFSRRNIGRAGRVGAFADGEANDLRLMNVSVPVVTIPNGYSLPADDSWRRDPPPVPDPYFMYLGYLDPRKQPDLLIRAFARSHLRETFQLVIVGPDAYGWGEELKQLARDEGVAARVLFHGPAYGQEKWRLLAGARCLCLPSRAEGMPLVLAEAIGVGTPSLFTPECNAHELAVAGAGMEVSGRSVHAWVNAIDGVVGCEARLRRMKQATVRLRRQYSWQTIAARWIDVYQGLARGAETACPAERQSAHVSDPLST